MRPDYRFGFRVWLTSTIILSATPVCAYDDAYCKLYSREMVRTYVRSLSASALPNVTVDGLAFMLSRYWTGCLNMDEAPVIKDLPSDGKWTADLWSQIQRTLPHPAGSVPASGPPEPVVSDPPSSPPQPPSPPAAKAVAAVRVVHAVIAQPAQGLCSSHGMRTVYHGRSWNCVR